MSRRVLETSWTRFLDADPLSAREEDALLRELATDADYRRELLDDSRIDAVLRQRAALARTAEDFVLAVARRLSPDELLPSVLPAWAAESSFDTLNQSQLTLTNADEPPPLPLTFPPLPRYRPQQHWNPLGVVGLGIAVAAAVLIATIALLLNRGEQRQAKRLATPPAPKLAKTPPAAPAASAGVAKLAEADQCVWDRPRAVGDRLEQGPLRLLKGNAKIAFDSGPVVELTGPATLEIVDGKHATLRQGRLRAETPEQPTGFTLETPTSRVVDQGAACELFVAADGATEVCVHRGEVDLEQRSIEGPAADRWRIGLGGSKRVDTVGLPPAAPLKPSGPAFKGVLNVNGQTLEFTDRAEYEKARKEAMEQFEKLRNQFLNGFGGQTPPGKNDGGVKGQINVNGKQSDFNSPETFDEVRRRIQEQLEQFQKNFVPAPTAPNAPGKPGIPAGGFRGQININGQSLRFDNPRTFMEAQRRLMEQLEQFRKPQRR